MGDHKKTHCRKGHELKMPNLYFNAEHFRQCRICTLRRVRNARHSATQTPASAAGDGMAGGRDVGTATPTGVDSQSSSQEETNG